MMDIFQESPNHFNNNKTSSNMISQLILKMTLNRVTVNGDFDMYAIPIVILDLYCTAEYVQLFYE